MKRDFDYSISLCRVMAMIMIVICHLGTAMGRSAIGEIFQMGVYLFLFISGYLYGNRKINNYCLWIKKRFLRVYVPFYIFMGYIICLDIIMLKKVNVLMLMLCLFNLQGYHHIFNKSYYLQPIEGSAHLWYLTVLLLCYLFTILMNEIEKRRELNKREISVFLMSLLIISCILGLKGIRIDYTFIYFWGYFYSRRQENCKRDYYISMLFFVIACLMRLLMKKYCDVHGDNNLYLYVIIPLSYALLAFWAFKVVTFSRKFLDKLYKNILFNRIMIYVDGLSLYVYITHYQFIDGPLGLMHITNNLLVNICMIFVFTIISSVILKIASETLVRILKKRKDIIDAGI